MMVKLKNIRDDRDSGEFDFKVFLTKRPEVYPSWNLDDPESDEEGAPPADVYFCMKVSVKIEPMDSLKNECISFCPVMGVLGPNLHFKGNLWLWKGRKHILMIS